MAKKGRLASTSEKRPVSSVTKPVEEEKKNAEEEKKPEKEVEATDPPVNWIYFEIFFRNLKRTEMG